MTANLDIFESIRIKEVKLAAKKLLMGISYRDHCDELKR